MSLQFSNDSYDPDANKGPMMIRVCVAMICFSSIGICGRFLARWLTKQPILWDDWFIVVALVFSWGCCAIQIIGKYVMRVVAPIANERPQVLRLRIMAGMRITRPRRVQSSTFNYYIRYRSCILWL